LKRWFGFLMEGYQAWGHRFLALSAEAMLTEAKSLA
jgi:hypothetical protein